MSLRREPLRRGALVIAGALVIVGSVACVLALEGGAHAADARAEAAARGALKKIAADYRAKRYAAAGSRLEKALRTCGDDRCAPGTRAALTRDLGTMQFRQGDAAAASRSFDEAIALDPNVAFDYRFDRPDVRAAFDAAKQRAADAAKAASAPAERTEAEPPPPAAPERTEAEPPPPTRDEPAAEPPPEALGYEHLWIGVAGAFDMLLFPSGTDLCKLTSLEEPANSFHAYCTTPDGADFPTRRSTDQNDALVAGQSGSVKGGLQIGDVRAFVTVDYALSPAWLLGARVGYVANAYPGAAAVADGRAYGRVLHAELRVTYLVGQAPLARVGFAPMLFLAGGVSEFDGHLTSNAALNGIAGSQRVNIWVTDGPAFVTLGGGLRYAFSLRAAFTAALRVNAALPGNGVMPTAGPELGFQYGF